MEQMSLFDVMDISEVPMENGRGVSGVSRVEGACLCSKDMR